MRKSRPTTLSDLFLDCVLGPYWLALRRGEIIGKMQNEAGETVDAYIPRKCSASGRIIGARDHASIQINIVEVDEKTGRMTGNNKPVAISGFIRSMGESDDCINIWCSDNGICSGLREQQN